MTAVEWLVQQLRNGKEFNDNLIQQAKEMEKKIIAQAFEDGDYNYFYNQEFLNGIEYYNEKFKSE